MLEPIPFERRGALDNLFQFYIHDFSELWAGQGRAELEEDGLFALDGSLQSYFTDPTRKAFFIRADGHLAGFALINAASHAGREIDFNVGEFFVARKHRRFGVGRRAAHLLFEGMRGRWEVAVVETNANAIPFWRNAIAQCVVVRDVEEVQGDGVRWRGPIFCFRT